MRPGSLAWQEAQNIFAGMSWSVPATSRAPSGASTASRPSGCHRKAAIQ